MESSTHPGPTGATITQTVTPPGTPHTPAGEVAAGYADIGLAVFPVGNDKRPHRMLGASEDGRGGLHHATRDPRQVAAWWAEDQHARIGVNLGASRLAAFDFEGPAKSGDPAACRAAIEAVFGPDALPPTWTAVTPSGGRHTLYAIPDGVEVRAGRLPVEAPGLDNLRAGGLYVILPAAFPETGHDQDGRYWTAFPGRDPAPVPGWVVELTRPVETPRTPRGEPINPDEGDATRYGAAALRGLWEDVATAPEGTRHATALRCARRAWGLADAGHVTQHAARQVITDAAGRAGLPDHEVAAILQWCEGVAA